MPKMISIPMVEKLRLEWIAARERRDRLRMELHEANDVAAVSYARWCREQDLAEDEALAMEDGDGDGP